MTTNPATLDVLSDVGVERHRQEQKCIEQRLLGRNWWSCASDMLSDADKLAVLAEEVGEIGRECCEARADGRSVGPNLRVELIQAAAICVAWAESLPASGTDG